MKIVTDKMNQKKKQANGKGDLSQLLNSAKVTNVTKTSSNGTAAPAPAGNTETNDTGKNLLRLLSQNDQLQAGAGGNTIEGITANNSDKTSASVQDFFAKAVSSGDGPSAFTTVPSMFTQPPLPITVMPIDQGLAHGMVPVGGFQLMGQHPASGAGPVPPPVSGVTGVSGINPMVQKLMSNPGIHSVDAIEAEQRKSASPNQEQQVRKNCNLLQNIFY